MDSVSAVVLAGGEGERLQPLTRNRPKPHLPVTTTPLLEYVFDQLIAAGVESITVVVGYKRNRIQAHFGPTYRTIPLTYVTQEQLHGSGHALLVAESEVSGTVLVVNGDQFAEGPMITHVLNAHDTNSAVATLTALDRTDIEPYGGLVLEDSAVVDLVENPMDDRPYYLNAGVYAFEHDIFDELRHLNPNVGELSLIDGILSLLESEKTVRATVSEGTWIDATYPWDLLKMSSAFLDAEISGKNHENNIASSAAIHDSAVIHDPVMIANDCVIGPGAVVGPYTCLGENVTVESNAAVERSIIDSDTRVGVSATVVDCVAGTGVRIGNGTTIPGGSSDIALGDRIFENVTLGAVFGDRVTDHGNNTYCPGTIVEPNSEIETGTIVRGTVSEDKTIKS
ncbi:NTP transferase domain-containing protein [Natronolimnobius sp. AArcel1]|uniref:sugar phosphate nucleotidyltransferase n=1 Tax=Natronolimnobius sp. AArcel1 TaxID=1679093 RepID=UPI0013EDFECA|nr:sugar phosphate nucleotidyltransferase [Natronolimnobius sp. AArcel1]NGM71395.1 NTP transferase domain-containing protein [Natronolimnobius sp. AArcel1]